MRFRGSSRENPQTDSGSWKKDRWPGRSRPRFCLTSFLAFLAEHRRNDLPDHVEDSRQFAPNRTGAPLQHRPRVGNHRQPPRFLQQFRSMGCNSCFPMLHIRRVGAHTSWFQSRSPPGVDSGRLSSATRDELNRGLTSTWSGNRCSDRSVSGMLIRLGTRADGLVSMSLWRERFGRRPQASPHDHTICLG